MKYQMEKLSPYLFAFDIDGVVADTMGAFIDIAHNEYGINGLRKEDITSYWLEECLPVPEEIVWEIVDRLIKTPLDAGLKPIEGAKEALMAFYEDVGSLTFVTARPENDGIGLWLSEMLSSIPEDHIHIIATGEHDKKTGILKEHGFRYFVEDNLDTCKQLYKEGIGAIVFDQPWNRNETPFKRITSWNELMKLTGLVE